jgi:hypothetical protein
MSKLLRISVASAALALCFSGIVSAEYGKGSLQTTGTATRTIIITPTTKSVNVMQGEVVKFVDQATGKSFMWHFDTGTWVPFDLTAAAPKGALQQPVMAYVCENACD